jgi:hypothetical protein
VRDLTEIHRITRPLRVGLAAGPVTGALKGRETLAADFWGKSHIGANTLTISRKELVVRRKKTGRYKGPETGRLISRRGDHSDRRWGTCENGG